MIGSDPVRVAAGAVFIVLAALCAPLAAQDVECTECHEVALADNPHEGFDCVDCHDGFDEVAHPDEFAGDRDDEETCALCHEDAVEAFGESVHGQLAVNGDASWLTSCASCHGPAHELRFLADVESPVHPSRLAQTCGRCHADPEVAARYRFHLVQPLAAYEGSVHAGAVGRGEDAANCGSCHGSHDIFASVDPRSTVSRARLPETCGECHGEIAETYRRSVHGEAAEHGIRESPVCTDCHGEHKILSPAAPGSPVFASNVPLMTCGRCHGDLRIAQKFGLAEEKVSAYTDSYHGLAVRSGSVTVAHCASCHGVHDILPSSDPESHVHRDNLSQTCGVCHPGAGATFAIGTVHVIATAPEHASIYWVRLIYLFLIVSTVGGMLLHNGLDLYRKARNGARRLPAAPPRPRERMSVGFRVAHGLLAGSFIVLVYTGFALTYPESWWAMPLLQWEDTLGLRGSIHRGAALVLLASAVFHLVHLVRSRAARRCIGHMRPAWADWRELKERLGYLFGSRPTEPRVPWLGYPEKIEYWAVIWGTVLMTATGFVLWFDNFALRLLPKWSIDVATTIHFYEAVLASLAIVVWHFYAVIFDPVVYPMDTAWLTGRSAPGREAEREDSR